MAVGKTAYLANKELDHLRGGAAFTQPAGLYLQLHTASPGASGATAVAGNATRQQGTFGTGASGGSVANTSQVQWTSVSTTETYTHASLWDASTAGNCLWTCQLTAPVSVTAGATFTMAIGQVTLSDSLAS